MPRKYIIGLGSDSVPFAVLADEMCSVCSRGEHRVAWARHVPDPRRITSFAPV
jgi:hypothetical protein